jgi:hypothetical protein
MKKPLLTRLLISSLTWTAIGGSLILITLFFFTTDMIQEPIKGFTAKTPEIPPLRQTQITKNTPYGTPITVLEQYLKSEQGSATGYDPITRQPLWVTTIPNATEPNPQMEPDPKLHSPKTFQHEIFSLSKLSPYATTTASAIPMSLPMIHAFNDWFNQHQHAHYIIAGPIHTESPLIVAGHPIPHAIYIIAVVEYGQNSTRLECLILTPNIPTQPVKTIKSDIKTITQMTGIIFFPTSAKEITPKVGTIESHDRE